MEAERPHHDHPCSKCLFLGNYRMKVLVTDLYVCKGQPLGGSVISRFGSDGMEYMSMPFDVLKGIADDPEQMKTASQFEFLKPLFEAFEKVRKL